MYVRLHLCAVVLCVSVLDESFSIAAVCLAELINDELAGHGGRYNIRVGSRFLCHT